MNNILFDFHTHITSEEDIIYFICNKIYAIINCSDLETFEMCQKYKESKYIKTSLGVHPIKLKSVFEEQLYKKADYIGEIGMDSVWSNEDLKSQKEIFIAQLNIAKKLNKPIIMHTKGQEREIYEIVKDFDMKKIIHWYSGDKETLKLFKNIGCYFTLGPDYNKNERSREVVNIVDYKNILTETDGKNALKWADENLVDVKISLEKFLDYISEVKNISKEELINNMKKVF